MKNVQTSISPGLILNWALALFGVALMLYRFVYGIGAVTNLSDGYPWGLWVGLDILAGIAVAAGGFVMAGTIYLFGGEKLHALARPAVLVAFLGYICYMIGTVIDIGRYWNIPKIVYAQNHQSPLFEIAMCVFMYSTVLFLEFLPSVFVKFDMKKAQERWYSWTPWLIVFMMVLFCWWMTHSWQWTVAVLVILLFWEFSMRQEMMPRDKQVPILMIMAGVIFSTMHQSTLGALYLIAAEQLHSLWYTPVLPILFLISAIMVAPAIVLFVAISVDKFWGVKTKFSLLVTVAKAMPLLIGLYLVVKIVDLMARGVIHQAFLGDNQSVSWLLEMIIGVVLPLIIFLLYRSKQNGMYLASILVIIGLIWNRVNVAVVGIIIPQWETYYPHWAEVFITIGIAAIGLLGFRYATRFFPIYTEPA